MSPMPQGNNGFTQPSRQEMRTSPDVPPISAGEKIKNEQEHERVMAEVLLAEKLFASGDSGIDFELWKRPLEDGTSLATEFDKEWPRWRSKHTKAVDGVALEAFLIESGLQEKAETLRDSLDKAA